MDDKERKYVIERRQTDAKGQLKIIPTDFYDDLPNIVTNVLSEIKWRWRNYDWFEEAWNKYRDHVLNAVSNGNQIKAPGFIFNSYIDEQIAADFDKEMAETEYHDSRCMCDCMHSDGILEEVLKHGGWVKDDTKGFVPKGTPGAHPTGATSKSEEESGKGQKKEASKQEKEVDDLIKKLREENERAKVINEYNKNLKAPEEEAKKAKEEDFNASVKMLESGRNITKDLGNIVVGVPGTKRVNPKETKMYDNRPYSEISDEELSKRVRRMQLERQYGDLSGDAIYEQTGKEKTREQLQTIGSILGIAISALTIYKFLRRKSN